MANVLGTGPVHVFLAFDLDGQTAEYYGTTREGPDITEVYSHYPVMNDLTGPALSIDDGYAGREDHIALVMTRWDELVDQKLEAYPRGALGGSVRGSIPLSALGTMIVAEGAGVSMWLVKAGAGRPGNVAAGMSLGRLYFNCELIGPNKPIMGNKENIIVRIFKAKNEVDVTGNNMSLFSEDAANFAGLPAIS